jgi:hypothetical protein
MINLLQFHECSSTWFCRDWSRQNMPVWSLKSEVWSLKSVRLFLTSGLEFPDWKCLEVISRQYFFELAGDVPVIIFRNYLFKQIRVCNSTATSSNSAAITTQPWFLGYFAGVVWFIKFDASQCFANSDHIAHDDSIGPWVTMDAIWWKCRCCAEATIWAHDRPSCHWISLELRVLNFGRTESKVWNPGEVNPFRQFTGVDRPSFLQMFDSHDFVEMLLPLTKLMRAEYWAYHHKIGLRDYSWWIDTTHSG